MAVLDGVNLPADLKQLKISELKTLAGELRQTIISTIAKNGGHLASNLGIVETTVALYHVFDFPKDKLIFDVGHQCYAHKILSGRKDAFTTIRTDGGISGFPDRDESDYDAFIAGHAGTSVAAGIGYCTARDKLGEDYSVVGVVGDASIANGLNLEALSVSGIKPKNFIMILNDNGMSISKNRNGLYQLISKGTTKKGYVSSKRLIKRIFGTSFVTRALSRFSGFIKRVIGKNQYFENYGFKYVGIVDGNDMDELVRILKRVKEAARDRAILLHVKTTKGKGHKQAEEHADVYHGVGANLKSESGGFSKALGDKINSLIESDNRVVAITAGMKDGTGLKAVEEKFPENFLDVGIAESFAVTSAAGMAVGGLRPFVALYSTFLQRAYDQVVHDVCLQNLPVTLCIDRAGLVGKDGKTHQGVFDLSYLLHIPNMSVFAPTTVSELNEIIDYTKELNSPVAIRYPKNPMEDRAIKPLKDGLMEKLKSGDRVTLIAVGPRMVELALKFAKMHSGVGVINARTVKPLDVKMLDSVKDTVIITLEENSVIGGFGSAVDGYFREKGACVKLKCMGVKDKFIGHGSVERQLEENGLTVDGVAEAIRSFIDIQERKD